jgi:hypothetical protein
LSIRSESRVSSGELSGNYTYESGGLIVAKGKSASPSRADVRASLLKPEGLAELSIFYCEEAFSFVES